MLAERHMPTIEELDAQMALELPDRDMLGLVTIIITDVLNNLSIPITVKNNNVAVQVCAVVNVLSAVSPDLELTCTITQ